MNNLDASVFDPPEALFHRTLHFALHCIGFISHNSLFPLQFRVRIEIPSVWRRSSALITFLVSYILKIAVATIIKIWGRRRRRTIISSTSAVTSQVIHVGWLYPTLVAWFRSWSFLHIRHYFLHSERERERERCSFDLLLSCSFYRDFEKWRSSWANWFRRFLNLYMYSAFKDSTSQSHFFYFYFSFILVYVMLISIQF